MNNDRLRVFVTKRAVHEGILFSYCLWGILIIQAGISNVQHNKCVEVNRRLGKGMDGEGFEEFYLVMI